MSAKPTDEGMARAPRAIVIASKAKQSRLGDCGSRLVWIASLSLAMTTDAIRVPCNMLWWTSRTRPPCPMPRPVHPQRGGASSTKSAVDRMEASCFRSFAAVNGLRPPRRRAERAPLTAAKFRKVILPRGWFAQGTMRIGQTAGRARSTRTGAASRSARIARAATARWWRRHARSPAAVQPASPRAPRASRRIPSQRIGRRSARMG